MILLFALSISITLLSSLINQFILLNTNAPFKPISSEGRGLDLRLTALKTRVEESVRKLTACIYEKERVMKWFLIMQ